MSEMISRKQGLATMVDTFIEAADINGIGVELLSVTVTDNRGSDGTVLVEAKILKVDTGLVLIDTYKVTANHDFTSKRLNWVSLEPVA